ncbi:pentatricopeptide repeat-containing protein At4g38010 [Ananas comosus]|uniref:Pentatricopeptide repeat-containing protein At4g38010 n=1 Tax=Ananas comosus TaxID=4615 RepID=A0A6P5GZS1_ANACO|nr:pentatricopeptide repeat-containing protein At4g38010 [Ananas comosus]
MNAASSPHRAHSLIKEALLALLTKPTNPSFFPELQALILTSGFAQDPSILLPFAQYLANFSFSSSSSSYKTLLQIRHLHHPSPFPFNSLIASYAHTRRPQAALAVYTSMARDGIRPDRYTLPVALKSCARFLGLGEGRQLHCAAIKMGFLRRLHVENALVHLYGVCGEYSCAGHLFDEMRVRDVVSWTGLISAYVKGGFFGRALELFGVMDAEPNVATLVNVLMACGRLGSAELGRGVHGLMVKRETELGLIVGNALVDMYAKCELLDEAKLVFEELRERDIVSWTSIISGLVQCKHPKEAIEMFHAMQETGLEPDKVILSSILSACASLGALDCGRWVHEYVEHKGIEWDVHIGTSMVDMYAKCGCLDLAISTFHRMPCKNVSSWNALIGGLAIHGFGKEALRYFDGMVSDVAIRPNEVTFIAILSACSHSGLVKEGRRLFASMTEFYKLTPSIEHYGCMVDLLGRAGLIEEAYDLIKVMPTRADVFIWGSMLSACKAHGNVDFTQKILGHLLEMEPSNSGVYVLLSNIYAINDRWGDVTKVRLLMREKGVQKEPGSSVIEVNGMAHEFLVGMSDHPQMEEIWLVLSWFSAG